MRYFLDFDRTIFDTSRMYREAIAAGAVPERFVSLVETAIVGRADYSKEGWEEFFALFEHGDIECIPPDATHLIYEDANVFLAAHGGDVVIVTAGRRAIQERKINRSRVSPLVAEIIYAGCGVKGPVIAGRYPEGVQCVFVDDSPIQLASVQEHCPWMTLYELQRDRSDSQRFTLVRSLTELP